MNYFVCFCTLCNLYETIFFLELKDELLQFTFHHFLLLNNLVEIRHWRVELVASIFQCFLKLFIFSSQIVDLMFEIFLVFLISLHVNFVAYISLVQSYNVFGQILYLLFILVNAFELIADFGLDLVVLVSESLQFIFFWRADLNVE